MAIADVTSTYLNTLSNSKYTTRTGDAAELSALKSMYSVYLNQSVGIVPDKKFTHGLALLILHHYSMDDTASPDAGGSDELTGSVTSESVGNVSKGYSGSPVSGSVQGWKAWLALSRWGIEFLYLMRTFKSPPLVT